MYNDTVEIDIVAARHCTPNSRCFEDPPHDGGFIMRM
jgi:hypothetical protein